MASSSSLHKRSRSELERETLTASKQLYDAFISHRGPDTKDTVAFALYDSLEEKGFCIFLDDQKLELGDSIDSTLRDAIYDSSVQIAIFSPRYAESPWCLNELVDMLKTKALFIPIFCNVKPSDVRYSDKGVYKDAFADHEKKRRYSKETLSDWKQALRSSATFSGHEFNTSKDNVEELCTKISLAVQQRVGKDFPKDAESASDAASTSRSAKWKKSSLLPRDSHPVGIHSKVEEIKGLLENPENQVIAVVGMGGLGKTFLLQNVYSSIKSRFENSIWLSISKSYSVKGLQHDIAFHLGLKSKIVDGALSEEKAAEIIHGRLEGKKSLIVLDDLWELSTEDDLLYKLGLPAHKDCKVIVTTRNKEVALNSKAHIYEMETLSDEDGWRLFCIYAFPNIKGNEAPAHMEEMGRGIVKQCGNLPLAIKTTAASLARHTDLSKWESKRLQLERAFIPFGEHDPVMDILKLSYDSLPPHLKPCFAYLSFFPEDAKIDCEDLVYIWIAEGFIPAEAGEKEWDKARNWIDQLDQLCLLHLWEGYNDESHRSLTIFCTIHDLLHDLAINISREKKCAFSLEEASSTHTNGASGLCRILLAKQNINTNALSQIRPAYLRTLSLSQNGEMRRIPEDLFKRMRGLRVLDLSNTGISTLPESLKNMILVKVLNLRGTRIREVPDCVRHLRSLLFLALPGHCTELPEWINELKCLEHLEGFSLFRMPNGAATKLVSLRTFRTRLWVELESIEDGLAHMTQLQEISFRVKHETELKRIDEGLPAQLGRMRSLSIVNWIGNRGARELQNLPQKIRAMNHLERLAFNDFVVPSWMCDLANLRQLELSDCHCIDYPQLEGMPNLVKLVFSRNKLCSKLPKEFGKPGAFPQLRFFTISYFERLEEFPELEEGAMPNLEDLSLGRCYGLKKIGRALERLKSLKVFTYSSLAGRELVETLKEGGDYRNKIKSINPYLTITRWKGLGFGSIEESIWFKS